MANSTAKFIETACKSIVSLIESVKTPIATIPPMLLTLSSISKPGLSAAEITERIISRQIEAGAPFGPASDGSQNIAEAMERIRVEEIIDALKLKSRVQVAIPPGGVTIYGVAYTDKGPAPVTGQNINFVHGDGIIG